MKAVCRVLAVSRSHVHDLHQRGDDWKDGRKGRTPTGDVQLLTEIRAQIANLPSYGYRRACALVNRQRAAQDDARVNPKRTYRVMAQAGLLLPKAPRRRQSSRVHDGKVAVQRSDLRWCSDGLKIKCDSGQTVTATFAKDCCDREVMAWRAWEGKGLPGEPVREMLIEAVENRFGTVEAIPAGHRLEFLTDNGGAYIAADTRAVARSLGLLPGVGVKLRIGRVRECGGKIKGREIKLPSTSRIPLNLCIEPARTFKAAAAQTLARSEVLQSRHAEPRTPPSCAVESGE